MGVVSIKINLVLLMIKLAHTFTYGVKKFNLNIFLTVIFVNQTVFSRDFVMVKYNIAYVTRKEWLPICEILFKINPLFLSLFLTDINL